MDTLNANTFYSELENKHGQLIGGADLYRTLGFKTAIAFKQAHARNCLPVSVFNLPNRKGKFAFTRDIATWLERLNESN